MRWKVYNTLVVILGLVGASLLAYAVGAAPEVGGEVTIIQLNGKSAGVLYPGYFTWGIRFMIASFALQVIPIWRKELRSLIPKRVEVFCTSLITAIKTRYTQMPQELEDLSQIKSGSTTQTLKLKDRYMTISEAWKFYSKKWGRKSQKNHPQ